MEAKHTPGPWEIDIPNFPKSRASILVHRQGLSVCRTSGTSKTSEANARLIAAAPDLLAACKLALEEYRKLAETHGIECDAIPLEDAIAAAINKAEGNNA